MGTLDNLENLIIDALSSESPLHTRELCKRIRHRKGDVIKKCNDMAEKGILKREKIGTKIQFSLVTNAENIFSFKFMNTVFKKMEQEVYYEFEELKNLKPITRLRDIRPVGRLPTSTGLPKIRYNSLIIKKARPHIHRISEILGVLDSCLLSLTYAEILFFFSQTKKNQVEKERQRCLEIISSIVQRLKSFSTDENDPLSILWKMDAYRTLVQIESIYNQAKKNSRY